MGGTTGTVMVGSLENCVQMAWAASHKVGCGVNKCYLGPGEGWNSDKDKGMTYYTYICNYCPM